MQSGVVWILSKLAVHAGLHLQIQTFHDGTLPQEKTMHRPDHSYAPTLGDSDTDID